MTNPSSTYKIIIHCFIWASIFIIETLLYWKGAFWGIQDINQALYYNLIINIPKIIGAYVFLLYILPYLRRPKYPLISKVALTLIFLFIWLLIYRFVINFIAWPIVFDTFPGFNPLDIQLSSFSFFKLMTPLAFLIPVDFAMMNIHQRRKIHELEKMNLANEIRFLKAQTNPHFLFNTLNSIYALARKQSDKTAPAIARLSKLLRFVLYETDQHLITLNKEIDIIKNYVDLEELRFGQNLRVQLDISVDHSVRQIPPLLLLTFVENAFKHGEAAMDEVLKVDIQISCHEGQLRFDCINPYNTESSAIGKGTGVQNAKQRLTLYFPDCHNLNIERVKNKHAVYLWIDLNRNAELDNN